jgi:hypothetical protein
MRGLSMVEAMGRRGRGWVALAQMAALPLSVALLTACLLAPTAQAGDWVQISCVNPNQTGAPSEGWKQFASGTPGYGSTGSARCPMFGLLSSAEGEANGNGEDLEYQPPGGSTLIGGSVAASGYAGGHGTEASGDVSAYTPGFVYPGDVIFQCAEGLGACSPGSYYFSGVIALPENAGGGFYIGAGCGGGSGWACNESSTSSNPGNPGAGAWASVEVHWANFMLSNTSPPAGSGFSGALLGPNASGTEDLSFTASDPGGPGVYLVTVQVDGNTLYRATPDTNSGHCVSVGSQGEAQMFDYSQPCKQSESVEIPVNTDSLADGSHTLKVIVTDAANNTATVYNGTITTENAPTVTSSSLVSGTAQVGSTLSGASAVFEARSGLGPLSAIKSQWLRCSGAGTGCSAIAGATSSTYTPVAEDKGYTIEYENTVEDAYKHKATAMSAPTVAVAEAPGAGGSCVSACSQGGGGDPGSSTSDSTSSSAGVSLVSSPVSTSIGPGSPLALRGPANGVNASDQANLTARWTSTAKELRTSGYGTLDRITGRLSTIADVGIGAAGIDVYETQAYHGAVVSRVGSVVTGPTGAWTLTLPRGVSSTALRFSYRSHLDDTVAVATATLRLNVRAGIALKIAPRSVSVGREIFFSGVVHGAPIPEGGKQLVLEARSGAGEWIQFNTIRTNAGGRYRASYRFKFPGPVTYQFRVLSRYEADFPFMEGTSNVVDVHER